MKKVVIQTERSLSRHRKIDIADFCLEERVFVTLLPRRVCYCASLRWF